MVIEFIMPRSRYSGRARSCIAVDEALAQAGAKSPAEAFPATLPPKVSVITRSNAAITFDGVSGVGARKAARRALEAEW